MLAALEGYFDKMEDEQRSYRNMAFLIRRAFGAKERSPSDIWPLSGDKREKEKLNFGDTEEEKVRIWNEIWQSHNPKNLIKE